MKKVFKRFIPSNAVSSSSKHLHYLGDWIKEPNLWHLNRRSVACGIAAGLFCAFLPLPGQILLASILAVFLKGNIILAGVATWFSNPLTYLPIFYFNYKVGNVLVGGPFSESDFQFTLESIMENVSSVGLPLIIGSTIVGLITSVLTYCGIRVIWRVYVIQLWEKRKERRALSLNRLCLNKEKEATEE